MTFPRISIGLLAAFLAIGQLPVIAADKPAEADRLSEVLIAGEDWQAVADNIGFSDGASADGDGNMYFSDMRGKPPVIWKIAPDGKQTKVADAAMSGTRTSPDGKLYGVGNGKLMSFDLATGKGTQIADGLKTNDLIFTHKGFLYLTETAKKQITFVDVKTGQMHAADVGINSPNGIGVSPDQSHLLVSEAGGITIWSLAIGEDGTLSDKKSFATMKTPEDKPTVAHGDGMIGDTAGRWYVTTSLGIQIFDADGKLLGILPRPQAGLNNIALAGPNMQYLYITCGTKVYRRKIQAKAALGYQEPAAGQKK
jgi:enterochelin esterase family protein